MLNQFGIALCLTGLLMTACSLQNRPSFSNVKDETTTDTIYVGKIESRATFNALAKTDENQVPFVKFSYGIKLEGRPLYFQNSKNFAYHFDFLSQHVERYKTLQLSAFDAVVEPGEKKELTVGTLLLNEQLQVPELNINNGALAIDIDYGGKFFDSDEVVEVYNVIKEHVHVGDVTSVVFVFNRTTEYFKYAKSLRERGVTVLLKKAFLGQQ